MIYLLNLLDPSILSIIQARPANCHKGNFGRVCCIGGNIHYGGAIIMTTQACIHAGAGLTTVITDNINRTAILSRIPEAMVIDWKNLIEVEKRCLEADVIIIGPGLDTDPHARTILESVISNQTEKQWLVIDGSALTILSEIQLRFNYPHQIVLTPHQMEWQRLSQILIEEQIPAKNLFVQQQLQTFVVLKSHQTEIYLPNGEIYQNPLGNPGMAIGGTGDTLAGIIGAFIAQFANKTQAILAAVYLHSLIADQIAKEQYIVLPTQLIQQIPYWMHYFSKNNHP